MLPKGWRRQEPASTWTAWQTHLRDTQVLKDVKLSRKTMPSEIPWWLPSWASERHDEVEPTPWGSYQPSEQGLGWTARLHELLLEFEQSSDARECCQVLPQGHEGRIVGVLRPLRIGRICSNLTQLKSKIAFLFSKVCKWLWKISLISIK